MKNISKVIDIDSNFAKTDISISKLTENIQGDMEEISKKYRDKKENKTLMFYNKIRK